jgi:hypothetical protein
LYAKPTPTAGLALVFLSAYVFLPDFLKILENWRS